MIKIVSLIICALFACILLKSGKSTLTPFISIFVIVTVCSYSVVSLVPTIEFVKMLASQVNLNNNYLKIILKCVAICFLCNICTNICRDSGESTLAYSAEIACRFTVLSITLPIYIDIFNWIIKLWENI